MRRIMIDAAKCDGCKSCSVACMQAHRKDDGNVYTLDLTDITNESRNFIQKSGRKLYTCILQTLRAAGMCNVLYERRSEKGRKNRSCTV